MVNINNSTHSRHCWWPPYVNDLCFSPLQSFLEQLWQVQGHQEHAPEAIRPCDLSLLFLFLLYVICVWCVWTWVCTCKKVCIEVRGQVSRVSSHLLLCFEAVSLLFLLLSLLGYLACEFLDVFSVYASHIAVQGLGL